MIQKLQGEILNFPISENDLVDLEKKTSLFFEDQIKLHSNDQSGHSLCKGLGLPFLPLSGPKLDIEKAFREAMSLAHLFVPHRTSESQGWKSLCLHGLSSQEVRPYYKYGYKSEDETPYQWTAASDKTPELRRWLNALMDRDFYHRFHRVRLMWLEPGGYIDFHSDRSLDEKSLSPMNMAINMPQNCKWIFKNWGSVDFLPGTPIAVDISETHGVWNLSEEPRIHIIVHGKLNSGYYNAILEAKEKYLDKISSSSYEDAIP